MTLMFWRPKPVTNPTDIESVRHEIRNALLGIQKERKHLAEATGNQAKALAAMKCHMERIERCLKWESY